MTCLFFCLEHLHDLAVPVGEGLVPAVGHLDHPAVQGGADRIYAVGDQEPVGTEYGNLVIWDVFRQLSQRLLGLAGVQQVVPLDGQTGAGSAGRFP